MTAHRSDFVAEQVMKQTICGFKNGDHPSTDIRINVLRRKRKIFVIAKKKGAGPELIACEEIFRGIEMCDGGAPQIVECQGRLKTDARENIGPVSLQSISKLLDRIKTKD